jgi:two-component system sensor histidine kinase ChvG
LTLAPDRTHIITSSRLISTHSGETLVMDRNARDIRRIVRAERGRLGLIIGFAILLSVLMSLFLARTIARPLRLLAQAARSVRLGRAREVIVPRLPSRSDEIGQLARAFSDMNAALQARIDATGNFAADVSHELKNPLASLASAAQSLSAVKDAALQAQLIAIITDDVQRLDRLITDISDLSRIDGQLARATFERIDIGQLVETLVAARSVRNPETAQRIAFARPKTGSAMVKGDPTRLSRALENLIDNAFSFSPPGGIVRIGASRARSRVILSVEDEGPGVPANARTAIFERFHSDRPSEESFGKHSGLGLSIVKAIVEAHEGDVKVESRGRGVSGARFVVTLQATP